MRTLATEPEADVDARREAWAAVEAARLNVARANLELVRARQRFDELLGSTANSAALKASTGEE